MTDRDVALMVQEALWGGFYRCSTTGRVLAALPGDDKVLCNCGRSNPAVPAERTEQTGTHVCAFLDRADVREWVDQVERDRARYERRRETR